MPYARPVTFAEEASPLGPPANPSDEPLSAANLHLLQDSLGGYTDTKVPHVTPEEFGTTGTGGDDYAFLNAAIATGKTVSLNGLKTYSCRRQLSFTTPGQIIHGNGATIKRPAQAITTTTTSIASGVTSAITVASASDFRVGDQIVAEQGGTYDTIARVISSIVGNVITISGTFGVTFTGTTNIRTSYALLRPYNVSHVRIHDLRIDGNRSNWSWARWEHTQAIWAGLCQNLIVEGCYIAESPGEGILIDDSTDTRIAFNTVYNANGNGIHLGASTANTGTRIIGNRVQNVNLDTSVGHADGCVVLSTLISDVLISGNRLTNGIAGVGSIDSADNGDITITDNEIHDCTSYAIEGSAQTNASQPANVTISNNRIYNSVQCLIENTNSSPTAFPLRWTVTGNLFIDTKVVLNNAQTILFAANNLIHSVTDSSLFVVKVAGASSDVVIANNVIDGGGTAVRVQDTAANVSITGNILRKNIIKGIRVATSTVSNIHIEGNVISNASGADANYDGILLAGPAHVFNNSIKFGTSAHIGIYVTSASGVVVMNNKVAGAGVSIRVESGSTNSIVKNNRTDNAIEDAGTTTIRAGNNISTGAASGVATLVTGTVTVSTAEIKTGDNVILSRKTLGGTVGNLSLGTIVDATSFVINSSSATDTSTVFWRIEH